MRALMDSRAGPEVAVRGSITLKKLIHSSDQLGVRWLEYGSMVLRYSSA